MTGPERTMVGTLQGIIAETSEEQIYIRPIAGGYDTWLDDLETNYAVERVVVGYPWFLLDHFKDYVDGYILYQVGDSSINIIFKMIKKKPRISYYNTFNSIISF
jgi:hypothetical protein